MRQSLALLNFCFLPIVAAGCASAAGSDNALGAATDVAATATALASSPVPLAAADLEFGAHGDPAFTGVLVNGSQLFVSVDLARLPKCRAVGASGEAQWKVAASFSVDGKPALTEPLVDGVGTTNPFPIPIHFDIPGGSDLAITFSATDSSGCTEADTNGGKGYHYEIYSLATIPTLSFNADFTTTESGPITAGQPVRLHYDVARTTRCHTGGYSGSASWSIIPRGTIGGRSLGIQPVTYAKGWDDIEAEDVLFMVPASGDLTLWFETSGYSYYSGESCSAYDSSFGKNYHILVQ